MFHIHINPSTAKKVVFATVRIGGPIAVMALSLRAGGKLKAAVEDADYKVEEPDKEPYYISFKELEPMDKVKVVAPIVLPAVIPTALTIAVGCVDKHLDTKHLKQMTALYSAAALQSTRYRAALAEKDPDGMAAIDDSIQNEISEREDIPWTEEATEKSSNAGDEVFVDILTGRRFYSTLDKVINALNEAEHTYEAAEWAQGVDGAGYWPTRYLSVNDLYSYLGIEHSYFGQQFGFVGQYDKDYETWDYCGERIHFHLEDAVDPKTHYIIYDVLPMEGWYEI